MMQVVDGPFAMASVGSVLVIVTREPPTQPRLDRIIAAFGDLARQHQTGIGFAWIIDPGDVGKRPTDEVRNALIAAIQRTDLNVKAGFIAILRQGLSGAAIRAVTNTVLLASRQTTPIKLVGSLEEGVP
jgi:hypothetical protein